jgi:hypothetical protein
MSDLSPTQTKIEPTMSVLYPTQTFRALRGAGRGGGGGGGGNAAPSKSRHEKTPHPRKGRGFESRGYATLRVTRERSSA